MNEHTQEGGVAFELRFRSLFHHGRVLAFMLVWLVGCASLPNEMARLPSAAIVDVGHTALAQVAAASTPPDRLHLSGLRLLPDAQQAFELRLALVREAQVSLDLQYYLLADDASGGQLMVELEAAARRGVRVRLLVDDLHAAASDAALLRLAALPQAEVRLFNPLPSRTSPGWATRMVFSLHEFERVNRRMHNKLFVADNAFAVTGGRNIADEYFQRGTAANFIDMDLLASGPVVRELSDLFDRFWNSEQSWPIDALAQRETTAGGNPAVRIPHEPQEPDALLGELQQGRIALRFAPVQLFADVPVKAAGAGDAPPPPTAMQSTLHLFRAARQDIEVVSPYFVPGSSGMALMREAAARGVHMAVTTNSLASTDEPLAYLGYARYRGEMLRLGVAITELSPTSAPRLSMRPGLSASVGRLHAKVAMVDRRWLLVGSMNMDARSARSNTELTLVIDSPELAAEMSAQLQSHWRDDHFRLRRSPAHAADAEAADGRIEWVNARTTQVYRSEPHVNWLARMRLGLTSMFVPEEWL
jgi:putative cardiolipin synthase